MPVKQSLLRLALIGWRNKACCAWPMRRPGSTNIVAPGTANPVVPDRFLEDFPCKEEKVEDFVVKLEEVVETKVAYFYTPSSKNNM